MPRPRQPLCPPQAIQELEELLKSEPPGWRRERLLAVQMGAKGEATLSQIADALGRARSAIQRWFGYMREGGLERLLHDERANNHGRKSLLSDEERALLKVELERGTFRSAPQIAAWVYKRFGIVACVSTVYGWLAQFKARLLVPRPSHIKKKRRTRRPSKKS